MIAQVLRCSMFHRDVDRFSIQTFIHLPVVNPDGLPWGAVIGCNDMETPVLSLDRMIKCNVRHMGFIATNFLSKLPLTRFVLVVKVEVTGIHLAIIDRFPTSTGMVHDPTNNGPRLCQADIDGSTQLSRRPFI